MSSSIDSNAGQNTGGLFDLTGQTVLVTGAAGGLGRQIALTLADFGAAIVLSDISAAGCDSLAATMHQKGQQVLVLGADLGNKASVLALAEKAMAWRGQIDTLVCSGGMEGHVGSLLTATDDDWHKLMSVNLQSALWLATALAPAMQQRGAGSIILISSIAGLRGNRAIGLYGVAKAGLSQLARNLAVELGPGGVRVNAVAPGMIETPLSAQLMADRDFMQRRLATTPLRRVGQPDEIAGVVTLLASRAGGFITGQTLVVDGGTLISDGN